MITAVRVICFTILLSAFPFRAEAEDFTDAIHAYLQQCVETHKVNAGIVVGIVDEHGSRVISYGKLDNGTDQEVNGDTLFEIASVTKTFTTLLLQDMIERGEMKLDDPVAKYLPTSVKMPTRNGKEITLLQLATHASGLPRFPDNGLITPQGEVNSADYTVEKLYDFLSGYKLTRDPGAKFDYSDLGMGLLGQAIALKAGTNYESLVVDRICRPLKMDSTRITLTPELKSRFATGHNQLGYVASNLDCGVLMAAGGLRSTANDLLKYVSANLGLTRSTLTPLMEKTHAIHFQSDTPSGYVSTGGSIGLAWFVVSDPQGRKIVRHGGASGGYKTFVGFDLTRRRGIVVLSNSQDSFGIEPLGMLLFESEWQSERRPKETQISSHVYDSLVGQYQLSPDFALGMFIVRQFLQSEPKAVVYIPAGFCLAVILVLLWLARSFRKRLLILGCAVLVSGLLAALIVLVLSHRFCAIFNPSIIIRREGEQLFTRYTRQFSPEANKLLPPFPTPVYLWSAISIELLPESETQFFNRLTGMPVTFFHDDRGKVTRLTAHTSGAEFSFAKISDQPPKAPESPKPHVAIKLDTKLLDVIVGQYNFAPNDVLPYGAKMTIWREGELLRLVWGANAIQGAVNLYPETETNFFVKSNGAELTFIKNDKGEITAVIHHEAGLPDCEGNKLKNLSE
jgi:CubicO group peptidase (beta-lactamase class C family)